MNRRAKPSDFVIPPTTSAVLLPSSRHPSFVHNSTKFQRVAYEPARKSLVTERLDPGDAPTVFNYDEYAAFPTSTGTLLLSPRPTPTTFIPHHLSTPSTWFNSLSYLSMS